MGKKNNKIVFQERLDHCFIANKDRIAIEYGNTSLTYGEVWGCTNYIANWILHQGIKKETLIGIYTHDRVRLINSVIGILKAGCIFVPLDPAYPTARLELMMKSVNLKVVISDTQPGNLPDQDQPFKCRSVKFISYTDIFSSANSCWYTQAPDAVYTPSDKIYIYFTSGTANNPKAIIGKNKSLNHFIGWEIDTFAITQKFRISQWITPGFDAFLRDLFTALCSGATLCIPQNRDFIPDADAMTRWTEARHINLIHCVPTFFRQFQAKTFTPSSFKALRYVLLSGERITPADLVDWYETFAERIRLVNLYGPTETTMIKTFYFIGKDDLNKERIPVGKPIKGARVLIFDKNMEPCNRDMVGEIYIRTPYGTYGYCNEPELNRECFIPNPFTGDPNDVFYKTGDSGRVLSDGNIDLLGRIDRQVKIRGLRIEPEEIETLLAKHPLIKESIVITHDISPGVTTLYGFITLYEGKSRKTNQPVDWDTLLKAYLSDKLPAYMVPVYIMKLEKIPRNPNFKPNYNLLIPILKEKRRDDTPPANNSQKILKQIWQDILRFEPMGIKNSFFELGGHSLQVIALISKIHEAFAVVLTWEDITANPSIEQQALLVHQKKHNEYTGESLTLLNPLKPKKIFCFPPLIGFGMIYKQLVDYFQDYSLYAFNYIDGEDRLEKYAKGIMKVQPRGPYVLLGYSAGGRLAFELTKEMENNGSQVSDLIFLDSLKKIKKNIQEAKIKNQFYQGIETFMDELKLGFLKEEVVQRAAKYTTYLENISNNGVVRANIHMITCEKRKKPVGMASWLDSTSGAFKTYQGVGKHDEMLAPGNIEKNAEIIHTILRNCEFQTTHQYPQEFSEKTKQSSGTGNKV
jgi:amino acid adenylation domain-containing protein